VGETWFQERKKRGGSRDRPRQSFICCYLGLLRAGTAHSDQTSPPVFESRVLERRAPGGQTHSAQEG
jgi:hypothetical protein